MKIKAMVLSLLVTVSTGVQASCIQTYLDKQADAEKALDATKYDEKKGIAVAGGMTLFTASISSLPGYGGPLVSTTGAGALIGSIYVSKLVFDYMLTDEETVLAQNIKLLDGAISVINEAYIGRGPYLEQAMRAITTDISTQISLHDLATSIEKLDRANSYCAGGDIATPAGILFAALEDLCQSRQCQKS